MLIEIVNDIREIDRVCNLVDGFCRNCGMQEDVRNNVLFILDEMLTNVINYAYPDGKEHIFTLNVKKRGNYICVEFVDGGVPFDPLTKQNPDTQSNIGERKIGGLGIYLVKQLSKSMEYQRINNENHVKITISAVKGE